MKKLNLVYWISTALFCVFILQGAIGNILLSKVWVDLIVTNLGYPEYIIQFLGIAKILGVIGILAPISPRLKEWAYAGIFFDLIGAMYSGVAVNGFDPMMLTMVVPFALMGLSYGAHHRRLELKGIRI
jgi:hypothetical protein